MSQISSDPFNIVRAPFLSLMYAVLLDGFVYREELWRRNVIAELCP